MHKARLHPSHPPRTFFRDERKGLGIGCVAQVRPAAELHRVVPVALGLGRGQQLVDGAADAYHADGVGVHLAEHSPAQNRRKI